MLEETGQGDIIYRFVKTSTVYYEAQLIFSFAHCKLSIQLPTISHDIQR